MAVAGLLVARNLVDLDGAPLGAYVDESSIGYNAWAIATHAVDEHGAHLPLYFTAFGEYKNPVYIYILSAVLRVLPLTVTTERLPAALLGLLTCACLTLLAWRRSHSPGVTLVALCLAGLTPWLTVESRVGFEVISLVAAVSAALLCLQLAQDTGRVVWYGLAGCLLAVAIFAYSTGRVAMGLLAVALVIAHVPDLRRRRLRWLWTLGPLAAGYAVLEAWNVAHPGALVARFNVISVAADGAPAATVVGRFAGNYVTYLGPGFLFVDGDHRTRHATQFGGMLLWTTLPLLLLGLVAAWRARGEPFVRFLVLGTLAAPVAAALTQEGTPHSLRAAVMLPFLLVLAVLGLSLLFTPSWRSRLREWRATLVAATVLALLVQGALYTADMYAAWPARSALDFDAGVLDAVSRAHAMAVAGDEPLLLSASLDEPYIQAAFLLRPPPPRSFVADSLSPLLGEMHAQIVNPQVLPPEPGALAVLSGSDPVPPGSDLVLSEELPAPPLFSLGPPAPQGLTVAVYRLG